MWKKYKWFFVFSTIIVLLPIVFGLIVWERLPEQLPVHWGFGGQADSFSDRATAVITTPALLLVFHFVSIFLVYRDPKNKNQSGIVLSMIFWLCPFVSVLNGVLMYSNSFGITVLTESVLGFAFGAIFTACGFFLPKCKPSRTVGIRLPWTLADEENWVATHKATGKVWVASGFLLSVSTFVFPKEYVVWIMCAAILLEVIFPIMYSILYGKRRGEK